jgi:hypothetical protein
VRVITAVGVVADRDGVAYELSWWVTIQLRATKIKNPLNQ